MKFSSLLIGYFALLEHVFAAPTIYHAVSIKANLPYFLNGFYCSNQRSSDTSEDKSSTFTGVELRSYESTISRSKETLRETLRTTREFVNNYKGPSPHYLYPIQKRSEYTIFLVLSSNMDVVGAISDLKDGSYYFCLFSYLISKSTYDQMLSRSDFLEISVWE